MYWYSYNSKIGELFILEKDEKIIKIGINNFNIQNIIQKQTMVIKDTHTQIQEYLDQKRKSFSIPYHLEGTEFQLKVWHQLTQIPYGETRSYKDIACQINNPKAYRAVGLANNKNHLPIIIPCHRVIGANKSLTGYAFGIDIKQKLLQLETKEEI